MGMPQRFSLLAKHAVQGSCVSRIQDLPDWELQVKDRLEWAEIQEERHYLKTGNTSNFNPPQSLDIGSGWSISVKPNEEAWESKNFGKRGEVTATLLKKGSHQVFSLNVSEYAEAGEVEMMYFSDDKLALQEFIKDLLPGSPLKNSVRIDIWY